MFLETMKESRNLLTFLKEMAIVKHFFNKVTIRAIHEFFHWKHNLVSIVYLDFRC